MWNAILAINSALAAAACVFTVYAAGLSIYYLTPRPIELGAILVCVLFCTEIVFCALQEAFD